MVFDVAVVYIKYCIVQSVMTALETWAKSEIMTESSYSYTIGRPSSQRATLLECKEKNPEGKSGVRTQTLVSSVTWCGLEDYHI